MAKKVEEKSVSQVLSAFLDTVADTLIHTVFGSVFQRMKTEMHRFLDQLEDRIELFQQRMVFNFIVFLCVLLGAISLLTAFFYYLTEDLGFARSFVFLLLGLMLLCVGLGSAILKVFLKR